MTDLTEIYEEGNGPPRFVARLSRTSTGQRTYTVGMSLGADDITPEVTRKLFALEDAIVRQIDGPRRSARASGQSVTAQLRRSLIVERIKGMHFLKRNAGVTTTELLVSLPDARRPQLVADLSYLVREGVLEVEQSKGRNPSRYRLAKNGGAK